MKKISKIISIGGNCIAADFSQSVSMRYKGPVDNIAEFNIWKSPDLFNNEFKKQLFRAKHFVRQASTEEISKYHFDEKIFAFEKGFRIVHNNFETRKYKKSMKERIKNFHSYYEESLVDESLWYLYSLDYSDSDLDDYSLYRIKKALPECCTDRLIVLGVRAKNPLFKKYFNYYVEVESEEKYRWGEYSQGLEILEKLKSEYGLEFVM